MKKKCKNLTRDKCDWLRKTLRVMKLTFFIVLISSMLVSAGSYSQSTKLNLKFKQITIGQLLNVIENQTEFRFAYSKSKLNPDAIVSIDSKDEQLERVLEKILKSDNLAYTIVDRYVVITDKPLGLQTNSGTVLQQNQSIKGIVKNTSGEPLPGVSVAIKGSSTGTISDQDGRFTLGNVTPSATVVFSFVGMKTQEIKIGNQTTFDVVMEDATFGIDEVVAIGYGTSSRRAVTGSVMKIGGEQIVASSTTNIAGSLQGKAAGVQITRNSGDPNGGINIRIRGTSSINSGGDPLIVVDGIPGAMSLNDINPNDIESIEILKDASAGAIYGSRAANGVVMVTTKKGSKEKSTLNFEVQRGVSSAIDNWEIADNKQLLQIYDRAWSSRPENVGKLVVFPEYAWDGFDRTVAEATNTNWREHVQNDQAFYNLVSMQSVGGSEKTKVFFSGYYRNYNSLNPGNENDKAQIRVGVDHELKNWLTMGVSMVGTYQFTKNPYASYTDVYTRLLPIYPVYSPLRTDNYFYDRNKTGNQGINPLYMRDETWSDNQSMRSLTTGYLELGPVEWLKVRSEWSLNFNNSRSRNYQSKEFRRETDSYAYAYSTSTPKVGVSGGINYGRYQTYNWTTNNYATFDKTFSKHRINVVAGHSAESYTFDGNSNQYEGFPSGYFTLTNANTELVATRQSVSVEQYRFLSYFGRAKYSYNDRYHAEFSYRADGSSRFGVKDRWGYFPGMSLGWVVSEEGFMKEIKQISYLKLRLSRGFVGNAEMGNYPYLSTLVGWVPYGSTPGFLFDRIGNDQIRWESQVQTNIGLDFTILNDRISGTFDYFVKDARDLIVSNRIGNFHGYNTQTININLGTLRNSGFDFGITTHNLVGELKWDTEFNISRAKSVITKLSPNQRFIDSGKNRVVEGYPLGAYFLPIWAGVDPVSGHELINGINQGISSTNVATIDDLSGEVVDAERLNATQYNNQRVLFKDKTPYPDFYGGLTNTFKYKGVELSFLFVYQYGNWIYDEGIQKLNYVSTGFTQNVSPDLMKGWTAENPTNIPLLWNTQMSGRASSRFLYDGSYVRMKNLTLAYQFPNVIMRKMHIGSLRVYMMGENLLTFTKYPGGDPEFFRASGAAANISPGIADITMPQVRTITFGLNLGL